MLRDNRLTVGGAGVIMRRGRWRRRVRGRAGAGRRCRVKPAPLTATIHYSVCPSGSSLTWDGSWPAKSRSEANKPRPRPQPRQKLPSPGYPVREVPDHHIHQCLDRTQVQYRYCGHQPDPRVDLEATDDEQTRQAGDQSESAPRLPAWPAGVAHDRTGSRGREHQDTDAARQCPPAQGSSGTRAAMEMMTALVKTNSAADERAWN